MTFAKGYLVCSGPEPAPSAAIASPDPNRHSSPSILDNLPPLVEGADLSHHIGDLKPENFTPIQARMHQWALDNIEEHSARTYFDRNLQLAPPDYRLPLYLTEPRFHDDDWFNAECRRLAAEAEAKSASSKRSLPEPPASTQSASSTRPTQSALPRDPAATTPQAVTSIPSIPAVSCVPAIPSLVPASALASLAAATDALFSQTESLAAAFNLPSPPPDAPDPDPTPADPEVITAPDDVVSFSPIPHSAFRTPHYSTPHFPDPPT